MFSKLRGVMDEYGDDHVVVDVGGVGYEVVCSARTLTRLPPRGEAGVVFIETIVREDMIPALRLRHAGGAGVVPLLTTVQGSAARVALAILSTLDPHEIATAIATQDKATIGRANGVGPKLAARVVQELKDKAPALGGLDPIVAVIGGAVADRTAPKPVADAVSALVNLGYSQAQASAAVAAAMAKLGDDAPREADPGRAEGAGAMTPARRRRPSPSRRPGGRRGSSG